MKYNPGSSLRALERCEARGAQCPAALQGVRQVFAQAPRYEGTPLESNTEEEINTGIAIMNLTVRRSRWIWS